MSLTDAHCHLHVPELAAIRETWWPLAEQLGIRQWMVNGLHEKDWPAVAALARQQPGVIPSYGLHPWYIEERSAQWEESLVVHLDANPHAGIGEIGLDQWVAGHDLADQLQVFRPQLALAAERNLCASIHCVQAWGALWAELSQRALPARGFLLHAYGGPAEMVAGFVRLGAYFSFSPYFLHERKGKQRAVFAELPLERLLIETDAPFMLPPLPQNCFPATHPLTGQPLQHPANLSVALTGLAAVRAMPSDALAAVLEENFARWRWGHLF